MRGVTAHFWQSWKYVHGSGQTSATRVNGLYKPVEIANCFADSFESVYLSNNHERVSALRSDFERLYSPYKDDHANDDISNYYFSWKN